MFNCENVLRGSSLKKEMKMLRNKWLLWLHLFWYNMQNLIWLYYVRDSHTHTRTHLPTHTRTVNEKIWRDVLLAILFHFFNSYFIINLHSMPVWCMSIAVNRKKKYIISYIIGEYELKLFCYRFWTGDCANVITDWCCIEEFSLSRQNLIRKGGIKAIWSSWSYTGL